ncbi:MAG: ABC transporter ATP-binding protein [Burkholderiales bacterium]
MTIIEARSVSKTYKVGDVQVPAVREASFTIQPSSFVCFVGPSGSGKSTLLNMLGCLDHPTSGTLRVLDSDVGKLDRNAAADFRGRNIGFIFQDFNLIPVLTAYENVEYPLVMVQNWKAKDRERRVRELLEAVGMGAHAGKRPDQLSGGQKQRVAVARALVARSKIVLADEPTANLDHDTAFRILDLMKKMRDEFGITFVFSTHDPKIMQSAEQTIVLEDGRIAESTDSRRAA